MEEKQDSQTKGGMKILLALAAGVVLGFFVGRPSGPKVAPSLETGTRSVNLTFVNHLQAELPEQDVFYVSETDSSMVMRVGFGEDSSEIREMQAYSTAAMTEHDPFLLGEAPLGPFEIGQDLGFTIDEWLSASGTGTYSVEEGTATLMANFENLVPSGVYTVWCSRIKFPPSPAGVDSACGALDGTENIFTADEEGGASVEISFPALRDSTEKESEIIALAYHSDGETYGMLPGEFGNQAHIQIFVMLPPPDGTN